LEAGVEAKVLVVDDEAGMTDAAEGLFLVASQGTIFLDEIGDIPIGMDAPLRHPG